MAAACCRSEDDLTHQLGEIIKANNRLRKQEESGAPQHIISEFALLLQMHITGYIDNSLPGLPQAKQRSGRPIKSICQRLKGERAGWGEGEGEEGAAAALLPRPLACIRPACLPMHCTALYAKSSQRLTQCPGCPCPTTPPPPPPPLPLPPLQARRAGCAAT